jgi:hypothetical protein
MWEAKRQLRKGFGYNFWGRIAESWGTHFVPFYFARRAEKVLIRMDPENRSSRALGDGWLEAKMGCFGGIPEGRIYAF